MIPGITITLHYIQIIEMLTNTRDNKKTAKQFSFIFNCDQSYWFQVMYVKTEIIQVS